MIKIKKSSARGITKWEWLESFHSFSFGDFFDPDMIHFGPLRVINEDFIAGGGGFPMHPHRDMEIVTYILEGEIEHQDSMGSREVIGVNQIQKMSAGNGIFHSEFNASPTNTLHLLQIWIVPDKKNLQPYYETKNFSPEEKADKFLKIGGPDGGQGTVLIHQDAHIFIASLHAGKSLTYNPNPERGLYLHVISGSVTCKANLLETGDAAMITGSDSLTIQAGQNAELLLFDLGMKQ